MSYDIYIGNAELESEWPGEYGPVAEWTVKGTTHQDAPFKPDLTQRGNSCHPGYSQWAGFVQRVGLHDAFFGEDAGLMREHPGIQPLTKAHLAAFEEARDRHRAAHPNEKPGMCECGECDRRGAFTGKKLPPHDPTLNFDMLRLDWLCWWTRHTLDTCERPAMANH